MKIAARRCLSLATVTAAVVGLLPTIASSATTATVEAISPGYPASPYWHPEEVAVTTGSGTVTFVNSSASVPHGVVWKSGPAAPTCEEGTGQVPVGVGKWGYGWKGGCTFGKEGVYRYYCSYHGEAMSGFVYVDASGTIPPPPPTATTGEASSVSETAATLNGAVDPQGQAAEYFFEYGKTAAYGQETTPQPAGAGTSSVAVSTPVGGLSPGTVYHYRLVVAYGTPTTTVLGSDSTFTTASPPGPPSATTAPAGGVSEAGASLKGTVNPGGEQTEYLFEWGTSTSYGAKTAAATLGADHVEHPVSAPLSGLVAGTVYHYRLIAKNAAGTSSGGDEIFTTASAPSTEPSPQPPPGPSAGPPPSSGGAGSAAPPSPQQAPSAIGPPLAGSTAKAVKLAAGKHGALLGSVAVSQFGAGGRLEVDVLIPKALLSARGGPRRVVVARLVRVGVVAGADRFSIALNGRARSVLRKRHRLSVTVKVTLTPLAGTAVSTTRTVVLRA